MDQELSRESYGRSSS